MDTAANIVPSIQIPDKQELRENEKVQCKSAQADLSEGKIQPEDIFQKIDLSGIADCDLMIQQEAQDLYMSMLAFFPAMILT